RPSARGELEITDLNLLYLKEDQLHVKLLSRGMAWLDTGTTTALLEASNYIATIEHRQGLKIACLEEVALRAGFITESELTATIDGLRKGEYGNYRRMVCDEGQTTGPEPVGYPESRGARRSETAAIIILAVPAADDLCPLPISLSRPLQVRRNNLESRRAD